jgi:hypothetical protein
LVGLTDPARELFDLCQRLSEQSNRTGDDFLAAKFGVEGWSAAFFEINFAILERVEELKVMIADLPLDDDIRDQNVSQLNVLASAFGPNGHRNQWTHSISNYLTPATLGPLSLLSGMIRPYRSYPKLDDAERDDLLATVDQLLEWLKEHQLAEQDFVRQALIDGVTRFRFRLARIQWIGWGYTLDSLREVIGAYFALEHGTPTDGSDTSAQATLKLVGDFVAAVYEKTKFAKEVVETGDFMLKAYGATTLVGKAIPHVVALLGN